MKRNRSSPGEIEGKWWGMRKVFQCRGESAIKIKNASRGFPPVILIISNERLKLDAAARIVDIDSIPPRNEIRGFDAIGIVGSDRFIIRAIHRLEGIDLPIFTAGRNGYLSSIDSWELSDAITRVTRGDYSVEPLHRLIVRGIDLPQAINEVAVFPARSATVMDYSLYIDNEYAWSDTADGVILSTPTGSTAYALSAGGVLLHSKIEAVEVVPVNSVNINRVPIVVPLSSKIVLSDLSSPHRIEVVVDGSARRSVSSKSIEVARGEPLLIIRFSNALMRYRKKLRLTVDLTPSAKLVYKVLEYEGPLTPSEIAEKIAMPPRTVRAALKQLIEKGLASKSSLSRSGNRGIIYTAL